MSKYESVDLSRIKTISVEKRQSRVADDQLAAVVEPGSAFNTFWSSLPDVLAAADLKKLVGHLVSARRDGRKVIVMMGAHVIKTGLTPILIDWMQKGWIDCVAVNGACAIHDTELAFFGKTSEDVARFIKDGRFGMAQETAELVNGAVNRGNEAGLGFGEAIGAHILKAEAPHAGHSLFAQAYRYNVPVTVHVGMGTDIVHQHPNADGAAIGASSLRDFRILTAQLPGLNQGGVVLLLGSSVMLPEVFLKALTVARNISGPVSHFTTANFDMIRHYRPRVNVLERPIQGEGQSYQFTGHHELMIPLLAAGWAEAMTLSAD